MDLGGKLDRIRCTRGLMERVIGAGNRLPFEEECTFLMLELCLAVPCRINKSGIRYSRKRDFRMKLRIVGDFQSFVD